VFVGAAGSAGGAFQKACERGNVLMALAAAAELPKPLSLEYALILTELFARVGDARFDAAAVRWLGRLIEERKPTLAGVRLAAAAVAALPDETAARLLRDLARRR
jgi:hypothetical protein